MCLPLTFLKIYKTIGIILTILISLFGIIYNLVLVVDDSGDLKFDSDSRGGLAWGLFGTCLILLFLAIVAAWGIFKNKSFMLFGYNAGLIIAIFVLFGLSIGSSIIPFHVLDNACPSNQQSPQWSKLLQANSLQSNTTFCQQNCSCGINNKIFNQYPLAYQQNLYAYLPYMSINNSYLPQKVQNCNGWSSNSQTQNLQELEQQFNCAGWCQSSIIGSFNEADQDPPVNSCYLALLNYYNSWGKKLMIGSWIIFFVILVNTIFLCCGVFHPQKKSANFYQKLAN